MDKVIIVKNPNGDTRSAPDDVSFLQFKGANRMHIADVYNVMSLLGRLCNQAGQNHDHTKISQERMFFRDFLRTKVNGDDFRQSEFHKMHVKDERHHLQSHVPKDVNLIDVLEYASDCVCAGLTRSGEIFDIKLDSDVLVKAFENTVELIKASVDVRDDANIQNS